MTTFQDPPPQSRRAARESERAGQSDSAVDVDATFDPFVPLPTEDTTAPPPSGRRARSDASSTLFEVPNAEPLTYSTQARDAQPVTPPAAEASDPAPAAAEPKEYRQRDFSPEGRRSAAYPSEPSANLDYRTHAGPGIQHPSEAQVPEAAWVPPVVEPTTPAAPTPPAQPLTRRELRAMREAADAAAGVVPLVEPEQPASTPTALTNAMAEFEALTRTNQPVTEITEPPAYDPRSSGIRGPSADTRVADVPPPAGLFSFAQPEPEPEPESVVDVEPEPVVADEPEPEPETAPEPELVVEPISPPVSAAPPVATPAWMLPPVAAIPVVEEPVVEEPVVELAEPVSAEDRAPFPSFESLFQTSPKSADADLDDVQPVDAEIVDAEIVEPELVEPEPEIVAEDAPDPVVDAEPEIVIVPDLIEPTLESSAPAAWPFTALNPTIPAAAEPQPADPFVFEQADPEQRGSEQPEPEQPVVEPFVATPPVFAAPAVEPAPEPVFEPIAASPIEETVDHTPVFTPPAWPAPDLEAEPATYQPSEPMVRETYTPPAGHWSRQADLDDERPFENTVSREVGGSNLSTATSALILPSIPQDFSSLINSTGEILVTGTIDLPHSLGTMGGDSRRYDDPKVDHMFDAFDSEVVSNDSAPVRAIRAVSTHTSSRGVIQQAQKPQSNRLLTVGIITASVLALGVVGLLAVYIINTLSL